MRIRNSNSIHVVISTILLFFSFLPTNFVFVGSLRKYICLVGQLGCLAWSLIGYRHIDMKNDLFLICLGLFQFEIIASALLHNTNFMPFGRIALQIISICILIRSMMISYPKELMVSVMGAFIFYAFINLIYRIPDHPIQIIEETGQIYPLGSDNEATSPLLLLFITSMLYIRYYKVSILSIIGLSLPFFTAIYTRCGTAIMVYSVFIIGIVMYELPVIHRIFSKFTNAKGMMMLYAVYYVVIWSITLSKLTFVGDLVNRLTGKDALTFTGRDVIWIEAFRVIRHNLLYGIGYGGGSLGNGIYVRGFYFGAHNLLLQWGVNGGLIAIVFFSLLLYATFRKMEKANKHNRYLLYLVLFMYLIAMSMENYSNGLHILPILTMLYYFGYPESKYRSIPIDVL